ncbi:hypothetical protein HDE78_000543 [Rhodanobacter sp. K2T2]|nr:hypothetical protein [Rhodanobacter sp. K2T2]
MWIAQRHTGGKGFSARRGCLHAFQQMQRLLRSGTACRAARPVGAAAAIGRPCAPAPAPAAAGRRRPRQSSTDNWTERAGPAAGSGQASASPASARPDAGAAAAYLPCWSRIPTVATPRVHDHRVARLRMRQLVEVTQTTLLSPTNSVGVVNVMFGFYEPPTGNAGGKHQKIVKTPRIGPVQFFGRGNQLFGVFEFMCCLR